VGDYLACFAVAMELIIESLQQLGLFVVCLPVEQVCEKGLAAEANCMRNLEALIGLVVKKVIFWVNKLVPVEGRSFFI